MKKLPILFFLAGIFATLDSQTINTGTLMQEMVNRNLLPEYPSTEYRIKQFSSYDRRSKVPDTPDWFANRDFTQFVREEDNNGRKEYVMFDAHSPGAVVRFWAAREYIGEGILRFYIDGNPIPVIEGEIASLLGGNAFTTYPFSAAVSEKAPVNKRGYNLYFPIAYAKSCKITYENDSIHKGENIWYNIGYREYSDKVNIQSFQLSDMKTFKKEIENTSEKLLLYKREIPSEKTIKREYGKVLSPNDIFSINLTENSSIRKIELKISAENEEQALRSTILKIEFDAKETVWVPVGDFFGTGYKIAPFQSWYTEVSSDGTLSCYWIMPYKETCEVSLENVGEQHVNIERMEITSAPWDWTNQTMYFGAGWYENHKMSTRLNGSYFDMNVVTLNGQGVLVGTSLTLYNGAGIWWGEGDEKIYIDNEKFPSIFGTGTEDYFGYAWCRLETYYHPFITQPWGDGNDHVGFTENSRYYSLDRVPFREKLHFDIEMWDWTETIVNYAPVSYYYMKEGGISNLSPQVEAAKNAVALQPSDVVDDRVDKRGRIEFEVLQTEVSSGNIQPQGMINVFSYNQQAWWTDADDNSKALFTFYSDYEGTYNAKVKLTRTDNYSSIRMKFNDKVCLKEYDCYHPKVDTQWVDLGKLKLRKGKNTIQVEIIGKNSLSKGEKNMCGLDCLDFEIN